MIKRIFLHDLDDAQFCRIVAPGSDDVVMNAHKKIRTCLGCFGCFIKTPGICVIADEYQYFGSMLSQCTEFIVMSRSSYGGFSSAVKSRIDRILPYILPFFVYCNGELHHKLRYKNEPQFRVFLYNIRSSIETDIAARLVKANALNMGWKQYSVECELHPESWQGLLC